jgi:hypothetical protein
LTRCNSHQPPRHPRPRGMTASDQLSNYGDVQTGTHPARRDPDRRSIRTQGRRPSLLRDEESSQLVEQSWSAYPERDRKGARSSVTHGYPRSLLCCCNECSPVEDPLWTSSKVIMRLRFSLLYDRPLSLRDLGLLTVASPQPVERSGRVADPNALPTVPRSPR